MFIFLSGVYVDLSSEPASICIFFAPFSFFFNQRLMP